MSHFHIKTEVFEGPLELLLALIEKRKLLINDISLAVVADDFIQYVETHPNFPIAQTAQFVLVASTLLLIKSRSLLPQLTLSEDEQADISDLEERLRLYAFFKELSKRVAGMFAEHPMYFPVASKHREPFFSPDASMTIANMHSAMTSVLAALPTHATLTTAPVRKVLRLEEVIEDLRNRVTACIQLSFREFVGSDTPDRAQLVVGFLALLELFKSGMIVAEQESHFSDILIESRTVELPNY